MGHIGWVGQMTLGRRSWGRKAKGHATDLGRQGAMCHDGPNGRKNKNKSRNNRWAARDVWAELRWVENRKGFQISDSRKWDSNQKF
jgi:hypothetical protein